MTTDDFTAAARAEAERKWPYSANPDPTPAEDEDAALNAGFMTGTEWARTYLAEQEPTHEEVIAATLELYARSHHSTGRQTPFESLDHEEQVSWVVDGRAVLSAARAVGRDAR